MTRLAAAALAAALLIAQPAHAATPSPTWPHTPGHYPVVYVTADASNHRWHWYAAIHELAFAGLRYAPGGCPDGAGCIALHGRDQGRNHGFIGTTWPHGDPLTRVGGYLNRYYAATDTETQLDEASVSVLAQALGLRETHPLEYADTGRYPDARGLSGPLGQLYGVRG